MSRTALSDDLRASWSGIVSRSGVTGDPRLPIGPIDLLTSPTAQHKLQKGIGRGILTGSLALAPARSSGSKRTLCPWAGRCASGGTCISECGKNGLADAENARRWRTALYWGDRERFDALLALDLERLASRAERLEMVAACRLNALSDVDWFPVVRRWADRIRCYDYTKSIRRAIQAIGSPWHLTYSWNEETEPDQAIELLDAGGTAAVVLDLKRGERVPSRWLGRRMVDGDRDDVRFLDPPGSFVGLRFKRPIVKNSGSLLVDQIAAGFVAPAFGAARWLRGRGLA